VKLGLLSFLAAEFALAAFQPGGLIVNFRAQDDSPARHVSPSAVPEHSALHLSSGRRIPFRVNDGLVYIEAKVQGKHAMLLVDTGAVLTTFSQEKIPTERAASKITINMARGSIVANRQEVGFSLGLSPLWEQHCDFRRSAIVGDFKFMGADGVVGLDVLSSFKSITFDFTNSVLILEDK
jgi:hypothetical protein